MSANKNNGEKNALNAALSSFNNASVTSTQVKVKDVAKSTSAPAIAGAGAKPPNPYSNVPKSTGYSASASAINSNAPVLTNPADDPFFTIRDRTKDELNNIKAKYKEFSSLAKAVDTQTSSEFKEVRRDLTKLVRVGERSVKELVEAVENVELNRFKYPAIKDSDLTGRKKTIEDMQNFMRKVKSGMEAADVKEKLGQGEKAAGRNDGGKGGGKGGNATKGKAVTNNMSETQKKIKKENDQFITGQRVQTMEMIDQQDNQLESLGKSVDRLGNIGKDINQELKEQDKMLDNLDKDMEDASSNMASVQEALGKLLNTKDGCQIWTIVVLALILIALVAMVIWV